MNAAKGPSPDFKGLLMKELPSLRAFGMSLCRHKDVADDLVQETLIKAWAAHDKFAAGTNIRAWLFTILRNTYFGDLRKRRREVADSDGAYAARLTTPADQMAHMDFSDFQAALAKLPADQREVLILVGASGFSYEEAAAISGVAVGTVKSRVSRAREKLAATLSIASVGDIGPEPQVQAVLARVKDFAVR